MKSMKRMFLRMTILFFVFFVFMIPLTVYSGPYPVRAVNAVVPYGAGGSTDIVFRAITADAEKYLGKPLVIINKSGGSGSVGANYVAKTKADGYTILLTPNNVISIYPNLSSRPAYTLDDFEVLCVVTVDERVAVVRTDAPWKSMKGMVEDSKKRPGTIRWGSPGVTSWGAFGYYSMEAKENAKIHRVLLKGTSAIVAAMLRGDVDVASGSYVGFKAQVDIGKFKAIGVAGDKRSVFLPEVPTYKEQGLDIESDYNRRYVCVRKEVPEEAKAKIEAAFKAMTQDPVIKARIKNLNQNLEFHGRPKAYEIAKADSDYFVGLIKKFDLKSQFKKK